MLHILASVVLANKATI